MTDRILDLAESPARLHAGNGLLHVRRGDEETTIPIADLACVVASHPQITVTQPALAAFAEAGTAFVVCDSKHLPVAMMLPLQAQHLQAQRFQVQATISAPTRKRLWQQIVRAKIAAQSRLLVSITGGDVGLAAMIARVRSGDPENVEAQAARRYWPELFGDPTFRRVRELEDQNRHLNYGYAVLRAIVARSVCSAGLHPSLGLHHHHRANAFCLADDLMEPYRPIVDEAVVGIVRERGTATPLDREAKTRLLASVCQRRTWAGEERSLFDWTSRMAASLAAVMEGETRQLRLPLT